MLQNPWPGWGLAQSAISAGAGLLGVAVGGWITAANQQKERRITRIREQLQNFYSPLLGFRDEIRAKTQLRLKIRAAMGAAFNEQLELHGRDLPDAEKKKIEEALFYDNEQLEKDIVPTYQRMLDLYVHNMWLAEKSTLGFCYVLVEFVEIWNRFLAHKFPHEIRDKVVQSSENLQPFYSDLQSTFDRLTDELRK